MLRRSLSLSFSLLFLCTTALATNVSFYKGYKEGWWWYKKQNTEKKKKEKPKRPKHAPPSLRNYTLQELWNMHPDDFQKLLNAFMKKAVQKPTERNIMEYLIIQDIARRKALAFAAVESFVLQKHPELSTAALYPVAAPGRASYNRIITQEIQQTIENAKNDFGLIMFVRQGCGYCMAQASILKYFVNKYRWPVRTLDVQTYPYLAARYNVTITPTIIVVYRKTGKAMPVSAGVVSLTTLEERLYRAIRYLKGEITPEEWFTHNFEKGTANDISTQYLHQTMDYLKHTYNTNILPASK